MSRHLPIPSAQSIQSRGIRRYRITASFSAGFSLRISFRRADHDRAIRLAIVAVRSSLLAPRANEAEPALSRATHASPSITELRRDTAAMNTATLSPDGARVVTAGKAVISEMSNKTLRAWPVGFGFGVPAAAPIACGLNILEPARTE